MVAPGDLGCLLADETQRDSCTMSRPLVSQVFGKAQDYRMTLGSHETVGGHEMAIGLRVCMYEEYMAATHHLRKDQGRISSYHMYGRSEPRHAEKEQLRVVGGTIKRILPGNFSCEVEWDNGQKGVYFQKVLYAGEDVPAREDDNYKKLMNSRRVLEQRPDMKKKKQEYALRKSGKFDQAAQNLADSIVRWSRWRPN